MLNSNGLNFVFYNFDKTDQSLVGSSSLVTSLRKHGYTFEFQFVETYDSTDKAYQAISELKPDVVGFSVTSSSFPNVAPLAKLLKEHTQALILLGGQDTNLSPASMPRHVDIWFLGKSDETIIEIFNSCNNYDININELKKIKNIAFFDENGNLQINGNCVAAPQIPMLQMLECSKVIDQAIACKNKPCDASSVHELIKKYWYKTGHLNEDQKKFLVGFLMEKKPRYCIETGFASGRSAVTTLISANPTKLLSIDLNLDYCGARPHANLLLDTFKNLTIKEGNSNEILTEEFFKQEFPAGIDYAFVDGDHSYNGAFTDISRIFPHLNHNGYMIIDDFESGKPNGAVLEEVNRAVHDFCNTNNIYIQKWHVSGKGFAILRKS